MYVIRSGNQEFEGENNAYLLTSNGTVTLVDTAIGTPSSREGFTAELHDQGLEFADVDQILLTHWHPDHTGLAGEIQSQSDATVYVHEADAPLVSGNTEAFDDFYARQRELFDEWGMPPDKQEVLLDNSAADGLLGRTPTVEPISNGETIGIGNRKLSVIHAPGHAAGLCCFTFQGDSGREAFVGDAILPKYTPNIGGADVRVEKPLATYLATLERLTDQGFTRVWPGHRDVIEDPNTRAREIIDHHRERSKRILDILREHGPADAWTVSAHLFGDLEGVHIVHGPGEAYAHLDHLAHHGIVDHTEDGYRLTAETPSLDAVI